MRYAVSPAPIRIPSSANTAPPSGCISAKNGQSSAACFSTAGSPENARGRTSPSGQEHDREHAAERDRPPDHPHGRRVRAVRVARAEHPADDHLAGDRHGVEDEREEEEELDRDLVRADHRVAHPRRHRRRGEERGDQRRRPYEDLAADPHHRPHLAQARTPRVGVRTQQLDDERDAHADLRDRRAGGRAGDAPVEAVDEQQLEHDVREVRDDDDLERAPQVRDAAEVALARDGDHRRQQAHGRDPEVGEREVARPAVPTEAAQQRAGRRLEPDDERRRRSRSRARAPAPRAAPPAPAARRPRRAPRLQSSRRRGS